MSILEGKRILITGGTGSLGKVLLRRVLGGELGRPSRVVVFSRDEAKQHDLRLALKQRRAATDEIIYHNIDDVVVFQVGDVRNFHSLASAMRNIDIVINAAALKQVPTCEYSPYEAVLTNIAGPENIIRVIEQLDLPIDTVVGVSTDKACKPVNVMGITKAIQERLFIQATCGARPRFIAVRYGNVLASRGSVIPLFHEQIRSGGPSPDDAVDDAIPAQPGPGGRHIFAGLKGGHAGEMYSAGPDRAGRDIASVLIGSRPITISRPASGPARSSRILISEEECHRAVRRGDYYVVQAMLPELRRDEKIEGLSKNYARATTRSTSAARGLAPPP